MASTELTPEEIEKIQAIERNLKLAKYRYDLAISKYPGAAEVVSKFIEVYLPTLGASRVCTVLKEQSSK